MCLKIRFNEVLKSPKHSSKLEGPTQPNVPDLISFVHYCKMFPLMHQILECCFVRFQIHFSRHVYHTWQDFTRLGYGMRYEERFAFLISRLIIIHDIMTLQWACYTAGWWVFKMLTMHAQLKCFCSPNHLSLEGKFKKMFIFLIVTTTVFFIISTSSPECL